jgi:tripartite-type tricarboxylate transporter receptor subunit TctC
MLCLELCAMLSLILFVCAERIHSAKPSGALVKIYPQLRSFYTWQNKLCLKEGNSYQEVERTRRVMCKLRSFEPFRFSKLMLKMSLSALLAVLLIALHGHGATSQTPRGIKIVVPFPPGGGTDILARLLGDQISRAQWATVVIENRPGAGSVIGTEAVSRAAPDGNTVLVVSNSFVINPILKKLNYDPLASFEPICNLVRTPQLVAVNSMSAYHSLADLLSAARSKPGALTLASVGPGTAQHIGFEMFKRRANVSINYVPYSGNAPAVNALLGNHVTSVLVNYPEAAEHLHSGKLRALATASLARIDALPDVPTIAESGFKDYEAETWIGAVVPAKTPNKTIRELASWFTMAMEVPEVRSKLVNLGLYSVGKCGPEFAAHLHKQSTEYARVIRESGIAAE